MAEQCVQCGHCCRSSACGIAMLRNAWRTPENGGCTYLNWTGAKYECVAVIEEPALSDSVGGIGSGCSSSMFNQDRRNIPSPEEVIKRKQIYR